ncbi:MAG: UvrD-helicase domain-containing protein, partial [Bdellovibrionales bacterium]|nr:UvrD-helicase domain-containing protein [Bdellovibrionales bacterium]
MTSPWLEGLNPQQQSAVKITEGPLLILAGAGSGKTTVLVSRAGHLVSSHKAKAHEILVLTFTNKAAKELKERVKSKIGKQGEKIWAGTFHGFGLEFLKKNHKLADLPARFGLLDATDAKAVLKELLKDHKHFGKSGFDIETLQGVMGALRSKKSPPVGLQPEYYEVAEWILPKYIDKMHALGVVDFDGLILRPTEILRNNSDLSYKYKNKFKYIMVDEFQDTNKIQMDFIKAICNDQENLA